MGLEHEQKAMRRKHTSNRATVLERVYCILCGMLYTMRNLHYNIFYHMLLMQEQNSLSHPQQAISAQ